jgi:hypothetical protein
MRPDLEVTASPAAQLGLFARAAVPAGTIVSRLVSGEELASRESRFIHGITLMVDGGRMSPLAEGAR